MLRRSLLPALLIVLACGTASASARTFVNDGTGTVRYKPAAITGGSGVACGVFRTEGVRWGRWGRWGAERAVGRGTLVVNTGEPTCADGNEASHPARLRLSRPRRGCRVWDLDAGEFVRVRRRIFTRIAITYDGRTWRTTPADGQYC